MDGTGRIHYGAGPMPPNAPGATGALVEAHGEAGYRIEQVEALAPFLVTVVSDSDLWLFAASNGALTCGRVSPATALFPYVTEDKLYDAAGTTGPVTALRVTRGGRTALWHPFDDADRRVWRVRRRLFKNLLGTHLVYEEENLDLGLRFTAGWRPADRYGFLRTATLENLGDDATEVALLDGLVNLMPGDADEQLQRESSVLLDAYKEAERLAGSTLAVYTLAAQPVDRPEPREALHATTVWQAGLEGARIHLDAGVRPAFDRGHAPTPPAATRGRRGAYLAEARLALPAGGRHTWGMVADVARTQGQVAGLRAALTDPEALLAEVRADAARGAERVARLVAATDGRQLTADALASAHHQSNVLFNDLRGGVYAEGQAIPGADFAAFVGAMNRTVLARHRARLEALPERQPRAAFEAAMAEVGDVDLARLAAEYLPLTFGRRHGDPSRPWNRFEIRVQDATGAPVLDYQGNWRDVFQNWEALSQSFPGFAEQILTRFVDASTADGHNPYRIGRFGVDWEVPEPDHPWSTIGYWGDHQVVYLLRLLELSLAHHPDRVPALLEARRFTYADVPYRFRPFDEILAHPRDTLVFDAERHQRILERVAALGGDGRLLPGPDGPVKVTLVEKLLVPALAKLSNLVPGAGIWMNTQRPEWNDANNALSGYGVSAVTLCHLDRYLEVLEGLLGPRAGSRTPLSREVARWLEGVHEVLGAHRAVAYAEAVDDAARGAVMVALGRVAADYRARVYPQGFSGTDLVPVEAILDLLQVARVFLAQAIRLARRPDGLFHAYQVLVPRGPGLGFGLETLPEMLEGQVAALATTTVDDQTACTLLDALFASRLYRADQGSFLLYPDRRLPTFLEKNGVPEATVAASPVLTRCLAEGDGRILRRDPTGTVRFAPQLVNAAAVAATLDDPDRPGPALGEAERAEVLAAYEAVFHHRAFTGRSGTMFAYEGLGSIYWHMVGKLLLAVQRRFVDAAERGASPALLDRFAGHYLAIRAGLGGVYKTPAEWGAFPVDAYSHTPAGGGARQPGMTGQVKEAILARLGELGVVVADGHLAFRPRLLRRSEALEAPATLEVVGVDGKTERLALGAGDLAFTICQVPVIYHLGEARRIAVVGADGQVRTLDGDRLGRRTSQAIFGRSGSVRRLEVWTGAGLPPGT